MDKYWDTYLPWFILREIPGLNHRVIKRLIRAFESPKAIFNAGVDQLSAIEGIRKKNIQAIHRHLKYQDLAKQQLGKILAKGLKIASLVDPWYPALLKKIPDPPPVLTYDGHLDSDSPCISIVGSRKATRYGLDTASHLANQLAQKGFTVVSGMAVGIDTAAHKGALKSSGKTLAILGSGLDHIYPRQNKPLYEKIRAKGAVISEFNLDTPPLPQLFPQRNRIIAGLSTGTIVVEAAQRSGSLITARLACEYNREVFAVPGSIRSTTSRGTHALLRQGAHLVEDETDILEELNQFVHSEPSTSEEKRGDKKEFPVMDKTWTLVYKHLDPYPKHIDTIIASTGMKSPIILATLVDMELAGHIIRHPGNYFSKSEE